MLPLAFACAAPPDDTGGPALPLLEPGTLTLCYNGVAHGGGPEPEYELDATLVAAGPQDIGECGDDLLFYDDSGAPVRIGFNATDADGAPITLDVAAWVGAPLHLLFRHDDEWVSTSGFLLFDEDGLVAGADEGRYGGVFWNPREFGFDVRLGQTARDSDPGPCPDRQGYDLVFEADDTLTVHPVASGPLTVNGVQLRATAIAAWDHVPQDNCTFVTDRSGEQSWIFQR